MDGNNMNGGFEPTQDNTYVDPNGTYSAPQEPEKKTKEVLALVFGICAVVITCCCTYLGIACGVVGIIMAIMVKNEKGKMTGMAVAGLICSIVGIAFAIVSIVLVLTGVVDTTAVTNMLQNMQ